MENFKNQVSPDTSDRATGKGDATRRFLSAREVANVYFEGNISYKKILELTNQGKIPAVRAGKRYVYRLEDLDRWARLNFATPAQTELKNIH